MNLRIQFQERKPEQLLGNWCLKNGQSGKGMVDKFLDNAGRRTYFYQLTMAARGKHCCEERGLKTAWAQAVQWFWSLGVRIAMYGNLVVSKNICSLKR